MRNFKRTIKGFILLVILAVSLPLASQAQCDHSVVMYDDFGDGWNDGKLTVMVDNIIVLDTITLHLGAGPDTVFFLANDGQEITTTFECGTWCYECSYLILDYYGSIIGSDGADMVVPTGILPDSCFANCTDVGLGEVGAESEIFNIFPNPASSLINIETGHPIQSISILDLGGRMLQDQKRIDQKQFSIDVSHFEAGTYMFKIETEAGSTVRKVIIE